ncbi:Pentatricopeptide repeat [Dillenia turbinata]|uniref:Pentatricopeptide repeat n=1 Tax=Dillenia turbinata TaxID=194707 RepID=A0AAN8V3D7_9MAGN
MNVLYQGVIPDNYTYTHLCVLKACSVSENQQVGLHIHAAVIKVGHDLNLFVGNGLVALYGKCDCLVEDRRILDEMPMEFNGCWTCSKWELVKKSLISLNVMITAFVNNSMLAEAVDLFLQMEVHGVEPDGGPDAVEVFSKMRRSGLIPDSIAFPGRFLDEGWYFFKLMMEEDKISPRIEHFSCMVDLLGCAGE